MHGDRDPRVTVAQSDHIYAALPGPKTLARFPTGGHESLRPVDPRLWDDHISRFLNSLAGAR
jgi:dipeptidyl aminopeptidase/acylaminoacyl peptidase